MKGINLYMFFIFFPFWSNSAYAQVPDFTFKQLTIEQGLSESTVRNIVEDREGYMWFSTEDGLNKYDGYNFKVYKNIPSDEYSISDNEAKFTFIDSKGNLWIATREGLNLYDAKEDRFYNYNSEKHFALKFLNKEFEYVYEDPEGNIWVTEKYGIYKISALYKKPEYFRSGINDGKSLLLSLNQGQDGKLWVGTRDGLCRFDIKSQSFEDLRPEYGSGYQVNRIHIDSKKNVWLASSDGLKVIDSETGMMTNYQNTPENKNSINGNNVIDILPYKENFLVAIDGAGVDYFDIKSKMFFHYTHESGSQLNCNNITSMFSDSKGDLWLGTFLNGINYSNASVNLFRFIKNELYSDKEIKKGIITSFTKDGDGTFWIATDGGGVFLKKNGGTTYKNITTASELKITSNIVLKIESDNNDIWMSTYNEGLNYYNSKSKKITWYKNDPKDTNSIRTNKTGPIVFYNGNLWVGTTGIGIDVLNKKTGKFKHYYVNKNKPNGLQCEWVVKLFKDSKNNLWLGTSEGLAKYNPDNDSFNTYYFDGKDVFSPKNNIYEIYEDKSGHLWLGTHGGGLLKFDPGNEKFQVYTTRQGLPSDNIKMIIEDEFNNLWIGTNGGIGKMNLKTHEISAYSIQDGVPPNAFYGNAKFKDEKGYIYFGASGGYLIIDPKASFKNLRVPPVVFTHVKVNNKNDFPGSLKGMENEEIKLSYHQNALTFYFAALNFNNPEKNKYTYLLEGFDKKWSLPSTQNFATYTNLNPGTYTFRIKGSNNDGMWNEKGNAITFEIEAPFWMTWWFEIIDGLIFFLIIYLIYIWRMKNIRQKNKELEAVIEERTTELKESNNQLEAFVYKASHDIRGPLKSVIGITAVGMNDFQDNQAVLGYFEHISKSTIKLDRLLSELLELTKVKQAEINNEPINFEEIIQESMDSFRHLENFKKIEIKKIIRQNKPFYSDRNLLHSIIQNLIENPIKYLDTNKEKPLLEIVVTITEKECLMKFSDNGPGIPPEVKDKVFDMFYKVNAASDGTGLGLYIVKNSVDKLKGKISLHSEPGHGSTFIVYLKK